MRCDSCGTENPAGAKFCIECGTPFPRLCPSCGRRLPPGAKFCPECGTPLPATGKPLPAKRRKSANPARRTPRPVTRPLTARPPAAAAEAARRQLTVMFCDLVDSTALSQRLDPEELREVVRAYQETCTAVIRRYEGYIAQHLGDGLLVYFGYPLAHEDDARRAVMTGLEIIAGLRALNAQLPPAIGGRLPHPLQVRVGLHTGVVVIGEIGGRGKREMLALGETPNIAARVQGVAEPDAVVMSAVTRRLVLGLFECQDLGPQRLKGISAPLTVYRVAGESAARSRFEAAVGTGLTPLVGREEELGVLRRRWAQAKGDAGQVVLLSGEAGIGKSRLVQTLKEQVVAEEAIRIEFRCSPYHQNSAFYPIIDHLQRLLQFQRDDTPQAKLTKLRQALGAYHFPQADTLPLFTTLLSLPQPDGSPPLTLSPRKQKQKTQEALVAWLVEEAEKAAVYCAWEDVHWADPSTLEVLTFFLEQVPTTRVFALLTFRPEFTPPWHPRPSLTALTLGRLGRLQVEAMVGEVTGGKALPSEVLQQIVTKTDGVPLFVEELTKMVLESGMLREENGHYIGAQDGAPIPPLAIPSTLHDSLTARLDRLAPVREIAQVGAVLGREFSYELLRALSAADEGTLQRGLRQLVESELIYQRGRPPQATYLFKHALIQDAAYQSLLRSKRQQLHRQIAQVLAGRFPEAVETQPELLAHHYTEAGLTEQAIPCWQQAGQRALSRSANLEAISHLTKGLELLKTLPDTPEHAQLEMSLQTMLGTAFMSVKGYAAPEVANAYARARELAKQVGETPQLASVLFGLWVIHLVRAEPRTAHEVAQQLMRLAQAVQDPALLLEAHHALGQILHFLGEFSSAREHIEQSLALYNPQQHSPHVRNTIQDLGIMGRCYAALSLWYLGYPDQALKRCGEALALAKELSHPFSVVFALNTFTGVCSYRRDWQAVQEWAEAEIAFSTEQGFAPFAAIGTMHRGRALAERGRWEEGIRQMRQGLAAYRATSTELGRSLILYGMAEVYGSAGMIEEGLATLAEAFAIVERTEVRRDEAEPYRIKGELTLRKGRGIQGTAFRLQESPKPEGRSAESEAEECFQRALAVAQKQQAKSLELRAVMSLARLWRQQGKQQEALHLLSEIYGWFTEGFDTKDLQEARMLLEELGEGVEV